MEDNQSRKRSAREVVPEGSVVQVIIVMGVSGAGKTTVGRALAARLAWQFIEGDEFHPPRNIEAMAAGRALTDADRVPWLAALRKRIESVLEHGERAVIACSALRHSYRRVLAGEEGGREVRFVQLDVPVEVLRERLSRRVGHFMPESLLDSQIATLERSTTALHVDGTDPVDRIVDQIVGWL